MSKSKVIAILLEDTELRAKWSALFKSDGVRIMWHDEQDDLQNYIEDCHVDLVVVNLEDMDRYEDMEYWGCGMIALSSNPDDIDMVSQYGATWLPLPLDKDTAELILAKL